MMPGSHVGQWEVHSCPWCGTASSRLHIGVVATRTVKCTEGPLLQFSGCRMQRYVSGMGNAGAVGMGGR